MKLIFVYNADSGVLNTVKDIGHKLFQPETYDCFLCSLTHGTFRENPVWKEFRQKCNLEMEFYHRDEFEDKFNIQMSYPVILGDTDPLTVLLSKEKLGSFTELDQLINTVKSYEKKTPGE